MPAQVASAISAPEEISPAATLPTSFDGIRAGLGNGPLPEARGTLTVTEDSIQWNDTVLARHADVIMHAVAQPTAQVPASLYAQLEPNSAAGGAVELRIVPDTAADLPSLFSALCAGAALAENALAASEGRPPAGDDEPMFTRMPDGSVRAVDSDALLDDSAVGDDPRRFEDADESVNPGDAVPGEESKGESRNGRG